MHGNFLRIFVFGCIIFHVFKFIFELISRSKSSYHSPRRTDAATRQTCLANDAQARHLSYALDSAVIFFSAKIRAVRIAQLLQIN